MSCFTDSYDGTCSKSCDSCSSDLVKEEWQRESGTNNFGDSYSYYPRYQKTVYDVCPSNCDGEISCAEDGSDRYTCTCTGWYERERYWVRGAERERESARENERESVSVCTREAVRD